MKKFFTAISLSFITLNTLYAAEGVTNTLTIVKNLLNMLVGMLITLALAVFFWGLVKFIFKLGGDKAVEGGKRLMIYGVISLFVMVSVWGLVSFIQQFFGINANQTQSLDHVLPSLR